MITPAPNVGQVKPIMAGNALFLRFLCLAIVFVTLLALAGWRRIEGLGHALAPPQNWILVLVVLLLGVPHGALDFVKARKLLRPKLLLRYVLAYVGVTAASFYLLTQLPQLMLPLLLGVASWHFGETYRSIFYHPTFQEPNQYWLRAVSALGAFAIGALPVTLCVFAYSATKVGSAEAFSLFVTIGGKAAAESTVATWLIGMQFFYFMPVLAMALGFWRIARADKDDRLTCSLDFLEILFTFAIFLSAPALLAFTVYFCFIHAPRHTAIALQTLGGKFKPLWLMAEALAVSLVAVALIFGLYAVLPQDVKNVDGDLVALLFSGLLSITVAHAAHDRLCQLLK